VILSHLSLRRFGNLTAMKRFERRDLFLSLLGATLFFAVAALATLFAGRFAPALIASGLVAVIALATIALGRQIQARSDESRGLVEASAALYQAIRPVAPLPPMTGYALAPDAALKLYDLVRKKQPRVAVEMGSGVSSVVIGYALKAQGKGHLFSLELNEEYARRTRAELETHGLGEYVTVLPAPLRDVTIDGAHRRWHDPAPLADVDGIDFVFDDGPPRVLGPHLREAALPVLMPKLSHDAVYMMNFVAGEERRTVSDWLRRFPDFRAEWLETKKGNVILRRGN
jgi:predicted O-methyltransferase YrrM